MNSDTPDTLIPAVVPRRRRKDARPQELLDAALELFVEKGYAATRLEEVAAHAGVSKGTVYLYYPSKEDLLKAVIRHHLSSEIAAGANEAARFTGSSADLLRDLLVHWWHTIFDSPASGVFKLVVTEVRNFPDIAEFYRHEVMEPGQALIGGVIRRGVDRGEFRPVNVISVVHSLVLPMVMMCLHKHSLGACMRDEPLVDPHAFIREHVELVLEGLTAPAMRSKPPAAKGRNKI